MTRLTMFKYPGLAWLSLLYFMLKYMYVHLLRCNKQGQLTIFFHPFTDFYSFCSFHSSMSLLHTSITSTFSLSYPESKGQFCNGDLARCTGPAKVYLHKNTSCFLRMLKTDRQLWLSFVPKKTEQLTSLWGKKVRFLNWNARSCDVQ